MIGGYVYLNEKLANDIVTNSGTPGSHEFKNCYDIANEAISTKKFIIADVGVSRFYVFSATVEGTIVLLLYGDSVITCTLTSADKNHYTIGG